MIGRIIKQISNDYTVLIEDKLVVCKARGKFRNSGITPIVGDKVQIDLEKRYILNIEKRKNELVRPRVSNIDQAIIITSVKIPDFSTNLLDKLLTIIEFNNIKPIICITKMDLLTDGEKRIIYKYINYYKQIGYEVYLNTEIEKFKHIFKDKITVFAGQSGAGKSTLLNKLDNNLNLKTNQVSIALGRGKHTTRHTELINVLGGLVADTPGFSAISFNEMSNSDIRDNFIEYNKYKDKCEYKDCMHNNELNCEVKKQINKNILKSRYENYIKFIENR